MKEQNTKIDYGTIGLILTLFMIIGTLTFNIQKTNKELKDTKDVVYYVSDKLDNTTKQIDELNEDLVRLKNELYGLKEFKRIAKELR